MSARQKLSEMESTAAFVVGGGLTLLILGFALASAQSGISGFDASRLNIVMIVGGLLFVGGVILWITTAQPWKNFDNWSTPLYTGHDDHAATHAAPHAATHAEHVTESHEQDVAELGTEKAETHSGGDDLESIEGIGPKIAGALYSAGIRSFADLAARQPGEVEHIVRDAGVRMVGHTNSWIEQAKLASEGKTAELEEYQHNLRTKH